MQSVVRHPAGAALGAAVAVAFVAAAGARLGVPAIALAAPAALAGGWLRRRIRVAARRLHRIAREDPLTGLGNRLLLRERLEYEILRHARQERPLAALALDLGGLETVGDDGVVEVARALRRAVRAQDTVARAGGGALFVLAPETDRYAATQLAARVRDAVADAVAGMRPQPPPAGVGVALYPHDARGPEPLIAHAAAAALQATRDAREMAPEPARRARAA
ncbi:MAG TPA: diguanylate cyclase [Solirubrobacteraceae bacterium]|nr:diguanylate cyclase [Solirubrobacteraceae bacterium]